MRRLPWSNRPHVPGRACCGDLTPVKHGAPGWIRTTDRRIRNPMLYPAELRALELGES